MFKIIKQYFLDLERKKFNKILNIVNLIQDYYLEKNKENNNIETIYSKTREEISALGITRIEFKRKNIIITLARPGLFIGRHGLNIDCLDKFLHQKMEYKSLLIREDKLQGWLLPYISDCEDF